MNLPEDGRIVVIDDVFEEGMPLVKALSAEGFPVTYFTGDIKELPKKSFSGIRVIFLDIVLGTEGQPDKTKISTAISVIEKIVSKKNGPFLVIAWTKHEELIKQMEKALKNEKFQAVMLNLEKDACKDKNEKYNMRLVRQKLAEKAQEIGMFHLFIIWENLIHRAAGKIVNDFSGFWEFDKNWNEEIAKTFLKLAEGYAGRQLNRSDSKEVIRKSLFSFNTNFMDALESEIRNFNIPELNISFEKCPNLTNEGIIAKINSKLLIEEETENIFPGNVYEGLEVKKVDISELFSGKINKYEQQKELLSRTKRISLEVSPYCDYAQNKWKTSRLLSGVLWPSKFDKKIKKADYIYKSPLIMRDNKLWRMIFDFRYFTSVEFDRLKNKTPLFRVRHELLVDIQSKLAAHVNRPGVMSVE